MWCGSERERERNAKLVVHVHGLISWNRNGAHDTPTVYLSFVMFSSCEYAVCSKKYYDLFSSFSVIDIYPISIATFLANQFILNHMAEEGDRMNMNSSPGSDSTLESTVCTWVLSMGHRFSAHKTKEATFSEHIALTFCFRQWVMFCKQHQR